MEFRCLFGKAKWGKPVWWSEHGGLVKCLHSSPVAVDQWSRSALGAAGGLCCTWGPGAGSVALGQKEKSHLQNILWVSSAELKIKVIYSCLSIAGA